MRGATHEQIKAYIPKLISIHAPRAGRDGLNRGTNVMLDISIHAPRAGRDLVVTIGVKVFKHFNPRAPCGARLADMQTFVLWFLISIHAPRAGRDAYRGFSATSSIHFNPRAPCGARLQETVYQTSVL